MEFQAALEQRRKRVDSALAGCFESIRPAQLYDATRWYPDAGGKRLRPVMSLLACEAAGGRDEDAMPLALAIELVHNFSLVHDDIMDRDATRRGRATVHTKWDEPTAILAGDVLFARAFEVLARVPDAVAHHEASLMLGAAIRKLCEGQAMDMLFERRDDVTPAEYVDMIRGKTAVLFEAACHGGALCADRRHVAELTRFGEAFGMAFQIADDLLDVTADSKTLGKPWGSDVRAGKRTLLVLETLARANAADLREFRAVLGKKTASDAEVVRAVEIMRACGALGRVEQERDAYAKSAADALHELPDSTARAHLLALNEWARGRGN